MSVRKRKGAIVKLWIMKLLRDFPLAGELFRVRVPDWRSEIRS